MTKFAIISDTHLNHPNIPNVDVLIHCGDATMNGSVKEMAQFASWFDNLDIEHKIIVFGNHDFLARNDYALTKSFFKRSVILQDDSYWVNDILIYGTPWMSSPPGWAFVESEYSIQERFDRVSHENVDVLITHCPPYGKLDVLVYDKSNIGSVAIKNLSEKLNPKLHCFGHIHESYGQLKVRDTLYVNASILDERYLRKNKPVEVEL